VWSVAPARRPALAGEARTRDLAQIQARDTGMARHVLEQIVDMFVVVVWRISAVAVIRHCFLLQKNHEKRDEH
jgi:hypothetical protein